MPNLGGLLEAANDRGAVLPTAFYIPWSRLRRRVGVDLVGIIGVSDCWPMPVALWNAPNGFDTREAPDYQPCDVIALRLSGGSVRRVRAGQGRDERLTADGFSVHPAITELHFVAPSAIRFAHIYMPHGFLEGILRQRPIAEDRHERFASADQVMYRDTELGRQLDDYVRRAFDTQDPPIALEMESRANLIALQFLKSHAPANCRPTLHPDAGRLAPWQVRRACQFMEENLTSGASLAKISSAVNLSPEHFCRAFRRTTGLPPHRWLLARRMNRARDMLVQTDASLATIAQELGYADPGAFGTAFRKATGLPPTQYRRTAR